MADFLDVLTSHVSESVSGSASDDAGAVGGAGDARTLLTRVAFESLTDGLSDDRVASMLRVLGWDGDFACFAIAGRPAVNTAATMQAVDKAVIDLGGSSPVCGVRDGVVAAVIRIEAAVRPEVVCTAVSPAFGGETGENTCGNGADGDADSPDDAANGNVTATSEQTDGARSPLCLGPVRHGVAGAVATLGAALTTLQAAPALAFGSPIDGTGVTGARTARPVRGVALLRAEDALPERALLGDPDARRELVDVVYGSLAGTNPDDPTMLTVSTFLSSGGSLETTARALNVHPNTVRYRLKRAADSTGWDATDPREAYVLTTAIALGRMHAA